MAPSLTDGARVSASPAQALEPSSGIPDPSTDPPDAAPRDPGRGEADPSGATSGERPDDTEPLPLEGPADDYDALEFAPTGTGDPTARGKGVPEPRSSRESTEGVWESPEELEVSGMSSTDHVEEVSITSVQLMR